jgi:hypothetical protein
MLGWPENWPDRAQERGWIFVCILHAVSGEVAVLSVLSVIRINNLRVYNAGTGSTPAASTTLLLHKFSRSDRRALRGSIFWTPLLSVSLCVRFFGNRFL